MAKFTGIMTHSIDESGLNKVLGWYCSRKLNGWRALWNGSFFTTLGRYSGIKFIYPPEWWRLPEGMPLDGELWHKSDDISFIKSVCGQGKEKSMNDPRWKDINYMVFGYKPFCLSQVYNSTKSSFFDNIPWIDRYKLLQCVFKKNYNFKNIELLDQILMFSSDSIKDEVRLAKKQKWEGLIFANPTSQYILDRSYNILKWKPKHDHEAKILNQYIGEGRNFGQMGGLNVTLTWDETIESVKGGNDSMIGKKINFNIGGGFSDFERLNSHILFPKDSRIKFSFLSVSKDGIPQSPNYLRE